MTTEPRQGGGEVLGAHGPSWGLGLVKTMEAPLLDKIKMKNSGRESARQARAWGRIPKSVWFP